MKRYIALLTLISLVLVLLILYQEWSEKKRLETIDKVRSKARQAHGISVDELLSEIVSIPKDNTLFIFYTGNTQSYLEPCGCYVGQSGGVARRATILKKLKEKGVNPIVVDAGSIFDGDSKLDKLKSDVYLQTMELMGYDAVGLSTTDLTFGESILLNAKTKIPFLSANITLSDGTKGSIKPYITKSVSGFNVAILGISPDTLVPGFDVYNPINALKKQIQKIRKRADIVLLLSSLPKEENRKVITRVPGIDLVISNQEGEDERVNKTLILYSEKHGKTVGFISLRFDSKHHIIIEKTKQIRVTEDIPDHPEIRTLLTDFYNGVAADYELQKSVKPLFTSEALESDLKNSYVGAENCKSCHLKEYFQWAGTRHAFALHSLRKVEKHFYPECVRCHSTGFGYKTGFKINQSQKHLEGVQCETCHGPGKRHIIASTKEHIRGKVNIALCSQCHDQEHSPGFMQVARLLVSEVDHSKNPRNLETIITERLKRKGKTSVELYIMSYCPYGLKAGQNLIPIIQKYKDEVDFRLNFIAKERKGYILKRNESFASMFTSLHGEKEVEEDMRQVVIAKYYPEKLLDYVLCRVNNLSKDWTVCAKGCGVDIQKIKQVAQSEEGVQLLRENIRKAAEKEITSSPTLLIDGKRIDNSIIYGKGFKERCE